MEAAVVRSPENNSLEHGYKNVVLWRTSLSHLPCSSCTSPEGIQGEEERADSEVLFGGLSGQGASYTCIHSQGTFRLTIQAITAFNGSRVNAYCSADRVVDWGEDGDGDRSGSPYRGVYQR